MVEACRVERARQVGVRHVIEGRERAGQQLTVHPVQFAGQRLLDVAPEEIPHPVEDRTSSVDLHRTQTVYPGGDEGVGARVDRLAGEVSDDVGWLGRFRLAGRLVRVKRRDQVVRVLPGQPDCPQLGSQVFFAWLVAIPGRRWRAVGGTLDPLPEQLEGTDPIGGRAEPSGGGREGVEEVIGQHGDPGEGYRANAGSARRFTAGCGSVAERPERGGERGEAHSSRWCLQVTGGARRRFVSARAGVHDARLVQQARGGSHAGRSPVQGVVVRTRYEPDVHRGEVGRRRRLGGQRPVPVPRIGVAAGVPRVEEHRLQVPADDVGAREQVEYAGEGRIASGQLRHRPRQDTVPDEGDGEAGRDVRRRHGIAATASACTAAASPVAGPGVSQGSTRSASAGRQA